MRRVTCIARVVVLFLATVPAVTGPAGLGMPSAWNVGRGERLQLSQPYGQVPLVFEPNRGQADPGIKWLARGVGYQLMLTGSELVVALRLPRTAAPDTIRISLAGARAWPSSEGLQPTGGVSNYFVSNEPKNWRTDIPHYRRVKITGVYPAIDLICYGSQQSLEYDLVVNPGADPEQIRLAYGGVKGIALDARGDLLLKTRHGLELKQPRPRIYQMTGGQRVEIAGSYEVLDRHEVRIRVTSYDDSLPLVIDPLLVYSTYLGGSGEDQASHIAVDREGSAYVVGTTNSLDFPGQSAYQGRQEDLDIFVSKLSPSGDQLVYSTYLGGSGWDMAGGIAVDANGRAFVAGATRSANFPVFAPYQASHRGGRWDAFVTKLAPAGNRLEYSTYFGGSFDDEAEGIAIDSAGWAWIAGYTNSPDLPTRSAYQAHAPGRDDAFILKLAPSGDSLAYCTYLGGSGYEWPWGIAVDSSGSAYITGYTTSADFPTRSPIQPSFHGDADVFITKLAPAGDALVYSTYLGGSGRDSGDDIAVDMSGAAYVTGYTQSQDFPTKVPLQSANGGGRGDAFVVKLTPAGDALTYATYLGGSGDENGASIAVDPAGSAYVTGVTDSPNFPTQSPLQALRGPADAFIAKLAPAGDALLYSTLFGGNGGDGAYAIDVDGAGSAYVAGFTSSGDFPTRSPLRASLAGGPADAFVAKLEDLGLAASPPVISGVANVWSGKPVISEAAWVFIGGMNLAPVTRMWRGEEIVDGKLPTSLDGVSVRINGRDAYVYYVSPTQINVQTPSDGFAGEVPVQVTNASGTSQVFTVKKEAIAPGLFAWPPGVAADGGKYAGAVADEGGQVVYIGSPGLLGPVGIQTRPARPNETVLLFVTGCGPTNPPFPAGQVVSAPVPSLASSVSVSIGGIPAVVAGGTGFLIFPGECQFNVTIPPSAADGDLAVELEIGGVKTQSGILVTVRR